MLQDDVGYDCRSLRYACKDLIVQPIILFHIAPWLFAVIGPETQSRSPTSTIGVRAVYSDPVIKLRVPYLRCCVTLRQFYLF